MNDRSSVEPETAVESAASVQRMYVLREQDLWQPPSGEMTLAELWLLLWQEKLLVASVTAVAIVLSVIYALTATKWYQGEVVMAPVEESPESQLSGALSGIASLIGANVGQGTGNSVESYAVLQSREFIGQFITDQHLLPVLFADKWDARANRWKASDPNDQPDVRTAIKYFLTDVMSVQTDRETKLVTLDIDWTDPALAATWANLLVKRLNDRMRQRAQVEARANVDYLQGELGKANIVAMQQAIGQVLEMEMQKLMLARGREEFAYRVVEHAQVPRERLRPRRALVVAASTVVGGMLAVFWVLMRNAVRAARRGRGARHRPAD